MSAKELAQAAKAKGNAAFSSGEYEEAVKQFTEAITHDPTDAIFYSNRSGAYASLHQPQQALDDAERCLQLNPAFVKGYSRKAQALFTLGRYAEAKAAYEQGLQLDASNATLKEGLEQVNERLASPPPSSPAGGAFGAMFGPDMWTKLTADPVTRRHLSDPAFVANMNQLQRNPQLFGSLASDPKVAQALGVLLGMGPDMFRMGAKGAAGGGGGMEFEDGDDDEDGDEHKDHAHAQQSQQRSPPSSSSSSHGEQKQGHAAARKEKPESAMTQEEKDKKEAEREKEAGNAAFKARRFDEAVAHYEKGAALDPTNIVFPNNISAAHYEAKQYEQCVQAAHRAIDIGREQMSAYKDVAKAWSRIGNAFAAQKRWDEAIEAYEKSLVEDYKNDKVQALLKKAKEEKKKQEDTAYLDPEKSEQEKATGNELFQQGKWVDAIAHYTEALRRNPHNYKVYSNRAACYTKLMDWQRGLDDCDACLRQDPAFVKAYIRKGKIHHFLKQYHRALEAFDQGLQLEPQSSELREERLRTLQAINSGEADPERAKEALKDPEIQQILRDPTIGQVLQDMQSNPAAGQAAMKDKDIRAKIEKLIAAGVLGVK